MWFFVNIKRNTMPIGEKPIALKCQPNRTKLEPPSKRLKFEDWKFSFKRNKKHTNGHDHPPSPASRMCFVLHSRFTYSRRISEGLLASYASDRVDAKNKTIWLQNVVAAKTNEIARRSANIENDSYLHFVFTFLQLSHRLRDFFRCCFRDSNKIKTIRIAFSYSSCFFCVLLCVAVERPEMFSQHVPDTL